MNRLLLSVAALVLLSFSATAQKQYYIDSSAAAGGDGSINSPFDSLFDLPNNAQGSDTSIYLARGSKFFVDKHWEIYSNTTVTTYGSGTDPVINGNDNPIYGVLYMENVENVWVEGIDIERAFHGVHIDGMAKNVVFWEVDVRDIYFYGGFAHENTDKAEGRVEYYYCDVSNVEGDGFSNRGGAFDKMVGCTVTHCGPIWGTHELDFRIPSDTRGVNYIPVNVTLPRIKREIYVDSVNGDDTNDGLSPRTAWSSVTKVNSSSLVGDRINLMNGSSWGDTFVAKSDQWFRAWGDTGSRANITHFNDDGFLVNDVYRVMIEGLLSVNCGPFVEVTGDVSSITIADCLCSRSRSTGGFVRASSAGGSGDITLFNNRTSWNEEGDVFANDGDYNFKIYKHQSYKSGYSNTSADAACMTFEDDCNISLYESVINLSDGIGVSITSNSENNILFGNLITECTTTSTTGTISTELKCVSILGSGTGRNELANNVLVSSNPATGEDSYGAFIGGTCVVKVYNNTFQDMRDSSGDSSACLYVQNTFAGSLDVRNNIFENRQGDTSSWYVALDADDVGNGYFNFHYNWYSDWDAGGSPGTFNGWFDNGGTTANLNPTAFVSLTDVFDGVVTGEGGLILGNATTNYPATLFPSDARIDDSTEAAAAHWSGLDLFDAGLVSWNVDGGHRPRGRAPTDSTYGRWMPGAFINQTGSPDGATTHPDSGIYIKDCHFAWCQNGIDPTHDQATTEDEMAVIGCTFENCYDGAFETLFTRAFPIRDCVFMDSTMSHIDILAPSTAGGDVWDISGNHFGRADHTSLVNLRSNSSSVTFALSNNIFEGLEGDWWARPGQDFGRMLSVSTGSNTVELHGNVFWGRLVAGTLSGAEVYCVQADSSSPVINANNNLFYGPDEANLLYVRYANASNIGSWDQNFYWGASSNTDKWDTGSNVDFADWKTAISDDAASWEQADRITARPETGSPNVLTPSRFRVSSYSAQGKAGSVEATARRAFGGAIRAEGGTWSIGPFAREREDGTLYWTRDAMVLTGFATATGLSQNFPIVLQTPERTKSVKIKSGSLANTAGTDCVAYIHEGNFGEGKVLWSGLLASTKATIQVPELMGSPGKSLYLSFGTAVDDIVGSIRADVVQGGANQAPSRLTR